MRLPVWPMLLKGVDCCVMTQKAKGVLAIITSAFAFAVMGALVRLCDECGEAVSCFQKGFFRNAIAFVIALCVFLRTSRGIAVSAIKNAKMLLLMRAVFGTLGIFANFYALSVIPIADGQALNKTAPFFTVLFAWFFLKEKPAWRQIVAIMIAFVGMLLVVRPGIDVFSSSDPLARCIALSGGIFAAAAYTTLRKLALLKIDGAFIVLLFSAFSCIASVPLTIMNFTPMNLAQVVIMICLGACAAVGQFGITLAYRFAAPKEIAIFDYTSIIFAAVLGFAFFSQIPDVLSFAGFIVIIVAALRLR